MKRQIILFFVMCLCLILCACTPAADPENLFASEETTEAQDRTVPTIPSMEKDYYQYGNMQVGIPAGNFMRYGDAVLFWWITDGQIISYSYDIASGKLSYLCKDAACDHMDCISAQVYGAMEQYQGTIYAETKSNHIAALNGNQFERVLSGAVNDFVHGNGNLYVMTADNSLLAYENGSNTPRVLLDEYTQFRNVVFGKYLYSGFGQNVCRVDLTAEEPELEVLVANAFGKFDGEYIYYDIEYKLYRCDMDGNNPEQLTADSIHPGSLNFDDAYLYFRMMQNPDGGSAGDCQSLYRMSKADPTEVKKIAEFPETECIQAVYTIPGQDLLFVECTHSEETERYDLYVMHTDGSDLVQVEFPDY